MKVCFETFGCRLNRAEALQQEAEYLAAGWRLTERHGDADLIVVRGCSVTSSAQRDCERLIDHIRRKYPFKRVLVTGCLKGPKRMAASVGIGHVQPSAKAVPLRTARAYLKVQDGCSGNCTFCIVPQFRGKSVSVPFVDVMDKAKLFIEAGYHEIVVTGCNLSLYASGGKRLPELLVELAELGSAADCRVRIGSLEPGGCAMDTVKVMHEHPGICRFLHIPVQSGSNRVLQAMQRPYLVKNVEEVVHEAVARMPMIGIGCDLMTGFPGENESEFLSTSMLLDRLPFSNAHIFPYSERPGTAAAEMPSTVDRDIRSERAHRLADAARRKRSAFAKRFVNRDVQMVIEDAERLTGWSGEYLRVRALNSASVSRPRKSLVTVRITETVGDHLHGAIR